MRTLAVVGAAIAVAALAFSLHHHTQSTGGRHRESSTNRPVAGTSRAAHSVANAAAIAAPRPDLATTRSYRLISTTNLTLSEQAGEDAAGPPFRLAAELRGTLRATDVERTNEKTVVQLVVRDAQAGTRQYEGARLTASDTSKLAELSQPFYAVYEPSGRLAEVYVAPETPVEHRNTMRTVAAALQFGPPPANLGTWSTREIIAGVATEVRYRQRGQDLFEKTFETIGRSGRATISVRDRQLLRVQSDETVSSPPLGLTGTGELTLELVDATPNDNAVAEWSGDRSILLAAGVATEVNRAAAQRASLANLDDGTTAADLLAMLQATRPDADDGRGQTYLMRRLAARFSLHADEAAGAVAAIRDLAPHAAAAVIGALSSVDNDQAESALADIATDDATTPELVADAANALSFHETPGDAAIGALQKLADSDSRDRRGPGLLGLGSVSYRLGEREDPRGERLVRDLLARYHAATGEQERVDLLAALGNTGSALILPAVEATIASDSPRLRHEAVVALRLVQAERADELLLRYLGPAESADLRLAALFAARFRDLVPLLPALSNLVRADPDPNARGEALELLGDRLAEVAAIRPVLEWVADRDPDEALRKRARALLAQA